MDMKNALALRKKRELLGGITKRKMSLRKYMDNLKQNECRLDITEITKCVFLGSLCLKPVPHLFDSPLLLEELDMKIGGAINIEYLREPTKVFLKSEAVADDFVKRVACKRKCLNTPKIRKKSLRETNEASTNGLFIKTENVSFESNESVSVDGPRHILPENNNNKETAPPSTTIEMQSETAATTTVDIVNEIENDIREEVEESSQDSTQTTLNPDSIPPDIKTNDSSDSVYDMERLKREPTPELILSDSDEDAIDQLMFNIMDIKVGPNVFDKDFFDMPQSDVEEYEELAKEFNRKTESKTTDDEVSPSSEDKKFIKRTPQCKICSQIFSTYMQLRKHKTIHNGDKPYLCLKCNENHPTLDQLIAHLRKHQGKRPYVCKKCNAEFKTSKALDDHQPVHVLQKVIPQKKVFKCDTCGKECRKLCDLERHTRVHTGEKPSVCNICNRRFQQAHNLNKHLLIHTQVKPYECDICSKRFGRRDVLNRHVLTHSVKKPNHCEICMKSFIRVSQLMAHKVKYHTQKAS